MLYECPGCRNMIPVDDVGRAACPRCKKILQHSNDDVAAARKRLIITRAKQEAQARKGTKP